MSQQKLLSLVVPVLDALRIDYRSAVQDAIRDQSMFNLLSLEDGEKVDFWILTQEPFDISRFGRKRTAKFGESVFKVSAPEDTILAKLRWAKLSGGSEKQMGDARSIVEVQGDALDQPYIEDWATRLGLDELWRQVRSEAE